MIAAAALVTLLQAATEYFQLKVWNMTGTQSMGFMAAAGSLYALKYFLTLHMLIETAAGSGITRERLEVRVPLKMDLFCSVFLVVQWLWKAIVSYKYRLMIEPTFLLAITMPGTLLWFVLFIWVYRKFDTLFSMLKDQKLGSDAVNLFIHTRLVLIGSILLASVVLLMQFADIAVSETAWNFQWVPYDAAPDTVYTLFLVVLMMLWWPQDYHRFGYSDAVRQTSSSSEGEQVQAVQIGVAESDDST